MQRPPAAAPFARPLVQESVAETADAHLPYGVHSSVSRPLTDAHIYHPGSVLALGILVLPVALMVGLAELALHMGRAVPVWLPVLALLGLPAVPLLWLALQSARTTAGSIAVGRPWRTWVELRWDEIEHVDQRGMVLRITGRSPAHETLVLVPRLLHDGSRLRREVLMRLSPKVLSVGLSREAVDLVRAGDIMISPEGAIEGTVEARTLTRSWAAWLLAALVLLASAVVMWIFAAPLSPAVIGATAAAALLALLCLVLAAWLPQRLTLDANGILITHALPLVRQRPFAWSRIDMVEYTPDKTLLRIRAKQTRTLCAGPRLFDSEQSAIVWRFIQDRCRENDTLLIKRRRLP